MACGADGQHITENWLGSNKLIPVRSRRRSPLVSFGLPGILGAQSVTLYQQKHLVFHSATLSTSTLSPHHSCEAGGETPVLHRSAPFGFLTPIMPPALFTATQSRWALSGALALLSAVAIASGAPASVEGGSGHTASSFGLFRGATTC